MINNAMYDLFIDKLSFTLPVPSERREQINKNFHNIKKYLKQEGILYRPYKDKDEFYNNIILLRVPYYNIDGYYNVKFLIQPTMPDIRYFKIEFNPNLLISNEDRSFLHRLITMILGARLTNSIWEHARITRIDLAIDILKPFDKLYVYMNDAKSSELFSEGDEITGHVAGTAPRLSLYDKNIKQGNNNYLKRHKFWYRYEIMQRDLGFSLSEVPQKIKNPFKKVSFYKSEFLNDDCFDKTFLNNAYDHGLNFAFDKLGRGLTKQEREHTTKQERKEKLKRKRATLIAKYKRELKSYYHYEPFRINKPTSLSLMKQLEFLSCKDN